MRAILFDTETGGLNAVGDALCSIGAVVFDTDAPTVDECILARAHWPICVPFRVALRVTERALEIQGLKRSDLADSGRVTEAQAVEYFIGWADDALGRYDLTFGHLWAWNAEFDGGFLRAAAERQNLSIPRTFRCAQQFAWSLQDLGIIRGPGGSRLTHWAEHYGLTQPEPHNAQADAEVAATVLWHLVRALKHGGEAAISTAAAPLKPNTPGTNTGHGHAWERPDGMKARCGGPALCRQCATDAALVAKGGS